MDEEQDDGNEGYYINKEEKELQKLKWNEQRARIFLLGSEVDIELFINNLKLEKWYKSSVTDGQISQVNFKYPVLGSKVFDLLPPNILRSSPHRQSKQQKPSLQILTSKNTHYNLQKMKQSSKYSSLDSLEQLRMRSNSNSSRSELSSSSSSASQPLPSINEANNNSNNFNAMIEEIKQVQKQGYQILSEQSKAQLEVMQTILAAMKESSFSQKQQEEVDKKAEQQQQHKQLKDRNRIEEEEEERRSDCKGKPKQSHLDDRTTTSTNDNNININSQDSSSNAVIILRRINELIGKFRVCSSYEDLQETLVNKEGFDFHEVMGVFVNNRHQIDTLIDIFKPKNNNSASQQQQTSQNVQQYQQNQQNQQNPQQEIQYPSFIQQGQYQQQFIQEQQKQQEVIEIENDEEKNNNHAQELIIQLQGIQHSNEINKPQMSVVAENRGRPLSPLHRQQDAEQKSIENNRKGYEQKIQKQSYSLSNGPKSSKPISRSKSPSNNYSPKNQSRSITTPPQKNLNQ